MMSWALLASCAYVPEVSTSMYTAWAWLLESPQPASAAPTAPMRNALLSMASLLGVRALDVDVHQRPGRAALACLRLYQALDQQRNHDGDVVQPDEHAARLAGDVAQEPQREGHGAHERREHHAAHRARGVDQRFQRHGDERQGERQ